MNNYETYTPQKQKELWEQMEESSTEPDLMAMIKYRIATHGVDSAIRTTEKAIEGQTPSNPKFLEYVYNGYLHYQSTLPTLIRNN
jgi:hypothetical protein